MGFWIYYPNGYDPYTGCSLRHEIIAIVDVEIAAKPFTDDCDLFE